MSEPTRKRRRNRLHDIEFDRVDIVDVGANQGADIVIAKNLTPSDVHMDKPVKRHSKDCDCTDCKRKKVAKGLVAKHAVHDQKAHGNRSGGQRVSDEERAKRNREHVANRMKEQANLSPEAKERLAGFKQGLKNAGIKHVEKAGTMPQPPQPNKPPAAPQPNPNPSAPSAAPQPPGGKPMGGPTGGMPGGGAPGAPAGGPPGAMPGAMPGADPGAARESRLQRLSPEQFELTIDTRNHREWTLRPDALPQGVEEVVVTMMNTPDGTPRFQWMLDPTAGAPISGETKTAAEAMMALRNNITQAVSGALMGSVFPDGTPAPGMGAPGMGGAPGAPAPAGMAAPVGGPGDSGPDRQSLIERIKARLSGESPSAGSDTGGTKRPPSGAPMGGVDKPAPGAGKPDEKKKQPPALAKALEGMARDFAELNIVKAGTRGTDLRDMLSSNTLDTLTSLSAGSADTHGGNMDIDALVANLPDEVVDYIAELQEQASVAKRADEVSEFTKRLEALETENSILKRSLAESREAAADAEWIGKARSLDGVIDSPEEFGTKLRSLADMDEDLAKSVFDTLKTASERVSKGALFAESGHGYSFTTTDAEGKVDAIAKALTEANPDLSIEEARATAWEQNPDLYQQHLTEARERARS